MSSCGVNRLLIDSCAGSAHAFDGCSSHDLISPQRQRHTKRERRKERSVKGGRIFAIKVNLIYKVK